MSDYTLCGGPQDGGRVRPVGGSIGDTIYVGPKWFGDGFVAWSREWSERFPARYDVESYQPREFRYRFRGYKP